MGKVPQLKLPGATVGMRLRNPGNWKKAEGTRSEQASVCSQQQNWVVVYYLSVPRGLGWVPDTCQRRPARRPCPGSGRSLAARS